MNDLVSVGVSIITGIGTGWLSSWWVTKKFTKKEEKQELDGVLKRVVWDTNTLHTILEEDNSNPRQSLRDFIEITVYNLRSQVIYIDSIEKYQNPLTSKGKTTINDYRNLLGRLIDVYSSNKRLDPIETKATISKLIEYKLCLLEQADMVMGKIHKKE